MAGRFRGRLNFGTRLLIGGLAISLGLIIAVSALLLVSRAQQTQGAARSDAGNRAKVLRALLQHVTGPQAAYAASNLAGLQVVNTALSAADAGTATPADRAHVGTAAVALQNEYIVVFDARGNKFYESAPAKTANVQSGGLQTVSIALGGNSSQGIEVMPDGSLADDFAVPVFDANHKVLGAALYNVPLDFQLATYHDAVGYLTIMIPAHGRYAGHIIRVTGNLVQGVPQQSVAEAPATLTSALGGNAQTGNAIYKDAQGTEVAGSVVGLGDPTAAGDPSHPGRHIAAYVGVEAPTSFFLGEQASDERTVLQVALTAAILVTLAVTLFVNKFVRRPVAQLAEGVARIAGGDYGADVKVDSRDELGLLAERVNAMRAQIAGYIRHVDQSVTRLGEVSYALTTTTAGVTALARAVSTAAEAIAGEGTHAYVLQREGDKLLMRGWVRYDITVEEEIETAVLAGEQVRLADDTGAHTLALPMFYQREVSGALLMTSDHAFTETDVAALDALANNAAVALENTRLYEQEKEAVRKLLELDAAKSDFLATAQHEFRTPVHAIMAHLDLMRVAWTRWNDEQKLQAIGDIERSTRLLGELLESIIDFSLLNTEALRLHWENVDVKGAVDDAVAEIALRYRDGIAIPITVNVEKGLSVSADPGRFRQVLRLLLDNAVKFSPPPKGSIKIIGEDVGDGNRRIDIADTGIGIDEAALPHIFDRFYQVDSSQTRGFGGMGMGLALVASLCAAHGASISVESIPGRGSTFSLIWPAEIPPGAAETQDESFHLADVPELAGRSKTDIRSNS